METEIEFERFSDQAIVVCLIEFNVIHDCDMVPYGEIEVPRAYSFTEIIKTTFTVNGEKYKPTREELDCWHDDITDAVTDAAKEAA